MAPRVPSFRQDKLPYRVIDVDATLSSKGRFIFCEADSISGFCVISHRWTDHVIKLMEEIKSSTAAKDSKSKLSYPQAVTEKNWADVEATREAYLSISNFLEILQAQGVKKVWMDVLCIDQSEDSTEKSREILLMGPYYRHSSACYVPIKGFGLDCKLTMGEDVTKYMSWLNRVWTLKEFLLPEKLYFLIELEEWMEEWLARRVASAAEEDLSHFCSCCLGDYMMEALQEMSEKMEGVVSQVEKIRVADINQRCGHCGYPPLLRKANKAQDCRLYLIQREAILLVASLAQFHKRVQDNDWEETEDQRNERRQEAFKLLGRKDFLLFAMRERSKGTWFDTSSILNELCNRECSEEADCVSGVLGLLGVNSSETNDPQEQQELVQVSRAAKTAEDQLVKLASTGAFTEQLLVLLCGMNSHSGRFKPQMSWIPNLTYRPPAEDLLNGLPDEFQSLATNIRVSPEGPITLTVKVLKGYVTYQESPELHLQWTAWFSEQAKRRRGRRGYGLRFDHSSRHYKKYEDDMYAYWNQFPQEEVQRFNEEHKDLIDPKDRSFGGHDGTVELTFNEYGSFILPLSKLTWLEFCGFEMWLLYLGHTCEGIVLLCLHKPGTGNVVHKIGTLHATYMGARNVLDDLDDPPEEITIAGYGKNLDECIDKMPTHFVCGTSFLVDDDGYRE